MQQLAIFMTVVNQLCCFCLFLFLFLFLFFKAGWKESHAAFMTELRNLQATGLTTIGQSLRTAFDLLNLNRLVTGIDNYGQVCSTEEAEKKSALSSVMTSCYMPPQIPPPFTPLSPLPSLTSINHRPTVTPHTFSHVLMTQT